MPTYTEVHTVTIETDSSGDAIGFTPVVTGKVIAIRYVKDDYAADVDFAITSARTGQTIWTEADVNSSKTVAPRQPTHDTAGAAAFYNDESDESVNDHIYLADDRVKIVVDDGGDTKSGTFHVTIG